MSKSLPIKCIGLIEKREVQGGAAKREIQVGFQKLCDEMEWMILVNICQEFQCLLVNLDALDTLVIQIEPVASLHEKEYEPLRARFTAEVKRQLSLTPRVELAASGQLPRFEMKAKRFRDMTLEKAKS